MRALPVAAFAKARVAIGTRTEALRVSEIHKLSRGVYWEAATKNGNPQAFAVNSAGDEIHRIVVENFTWKKGEATVRFLWNLLNVEDPATTVGVIRPLFALPAPARLARDPHDPYAEQGVPGRMRTPW